jgi:hypothetical protein
MRSRVQPPPSLLRENLAQSAGFFHFMAVESLLSKGIGNGKPCIASEASKGFTGVRLPKKESLITPRA